MPPKAALLLPSLPYLLLGAVSVPSLAVCERMEAQATPPVDTLTAQLLSRHPAIGQPGIIQPWGKYILLSDWTGDPNLHVIDGSTGELIVSFGRIGPGPGQFANLIAGIQVPSHDISAAWVFDARKLTRIESPGAVPPDASTIDLTVIPQLLRAAWLDSATIVGVNLQPPEERFVFFDAAGRLTRTVPGTLLGPDHVPLLPRVDASSQFSLCSHPQGTGFAVVYKTAGVVKIYDRTATHRADGAVPFSVEARFDVVNGEVQYIPERITYPSCWGGTEFLYALYSGGNFDARPANALEGREIHVFDWVSGALVRKIHLDVPIFGFSVVEELGWLYAGSLSDAGIYRFRLVGAVGSG